MNGVANESSDTSAETKVQHRCVRTLPSRLLPLSHGTSPKPGPILYSLSPSHTKRIFLNPSLCVCSLVWTVYCWWTNANLIVRLWSWISRHWFHSPRSPLSQRWSRPTQCQTRRNLRSACSFAGRRSLHASLRLSRLMTMGAGLVAPTSIEWGLGLPRRSREVSRWRNWFVIRCILLLNVNDDLCHIYIFSCRSSKLLIHL